MIKRFLWSAKKSTELTMIQSDESQLQSKENLTKSLYLQHAPGKLGHLLQYITKSNFAQPKRYKAHFLKKMVPETGTVLDVGCGNSSPWWTKTLLPNIYYVGIDIGDYNQTAPNLADEYVISSPDDFSESISLMGQRFDAVISSANLEHCDHRQKTLEAMVSVIKPGGVLYLTFPTEKSVSFPGPRWGCLNYYDDGTHKGEPPNYKETIEFLQKDMEIVYGSKSYKPFFFYVVGFFNESTSNKYKTVMQGTWEYWGLLSVIWAKKKE